MRCENCPRYCAVDREAGERGFCGAGAEPEVALRDLHMWEEPPISGTRGSGAVFFARCNLRCVFCQNHVISQGTDQVATGDAVRGTSESADGIERTGAGRGSGWTVMSTERLCDAYLELQNRGAHNINLVSPTHYADRIAKSVRLAKGRGLRIPVVYNTNGYDSTEGLAEMDGLVDVYLPDLKYFSDDMALRYSSAPAYFDRASRAVREMSRQAGVPVLDDDGLIKRGLIVRHLVLPGGADDSIRVLRWIKDNLPGGTFVSLMAQYYPCHRASQYPPLDRRLTEKEYDSVVNELYRLDLEDGFIQELSSAEPDYTPNFSCERGT